VRLGLRFSPNRHGLPLSMYARNVHTHTHTHTQLNFSLSNARDASYTSLASMWPEAYLHDPCDELECTDANRHLVLGGSVAQWGASAGNFDSATWQGAVAAAERLWAGSIRNADPPVVTPSGAVRRDILDRLAVHACRMSLRGVEMGFYPGTGSLAGTTHWPRGREGDTDFVPRAACPSEWLPPA
jgi:hypothetical protein